MATNEFRQIDVVAGLIFRDQRVLACQRHSTADFPLKWEFPGGKVERDEASKDALCRELKEELAIDVLESAEFYQHEHHYPGGLTVRLRFFEVLKYRGEVENRVFEQIAWVRFTELPNLDFLDGDKPLIDRLAATEAAKIGR